MLRIEFCLFHREKYISYGCVLEMYGKKSISTLPNRELGKCNEIRNNRDLISGEVLRRELKIIDKSRTPRLFKVMGVITLEKRFLMLLPWTG